jgi:hypothetical protein
MNPGGLAQAMRKLKAELEARWGKLDLHDIARRVARSYPWAIGMLGARKLFFGIFFLIVVTIMLYFLSLR